MDEYRNDGANGFVMTDASGNVSDKDITMTLNDEEALHIDPEQLGESQPAADAAQTAEFERIDPKADASHTMEYERAEPDTGSFEETGFTQGAYEQTGYSQGAYDQSTYEQTGYASWANGETTFHKESRKEKRQRIKAEKELAKMNKVKKTVSFTRRSLAAFVICLSLASFAFGCGGSILGHSIMDNDTASSTSSGQTYSQAQDTDNVAGKRSSGYDLASATGSNMTVQQINNAVGNSVVEIQTESTTTDDWLQQYVTEGAGSGVIISEDGYIMTNNHVVEGASKIKVTTKDGSEYSAELVGTDSMNDVAVIKISAKGLTKAVYGNSSELQVGDLAVAIGNPLGQLGGTVTAGIISATDRQVVIDGKNMHLLQTDSSINPGNSGGGLFNGDGQLIGLVVAKSSGSDVEGLGFAIPINTAAECAQQLMDKGYVSNQPYTGMAYTEASDSTDGFDMFFGGQSASSYVYIYSVESREAKQAGFMAGDIVLAVDGQKITTFEDLQTVITSHKVGDKLKYIIERNGEQLSLTLTLQERKN